MAVWNQTPTAILLIGSATLLAVWLAWRRIDLARRQRGFRLAHGALPPRSADRFDPVFGIDNFFRLAKAAREGRLLRYWQQEMYGRHGNTFQVTLMGPTVFFTSEPQNIQAILATKFADFEIGQRRRDQGADIIGVAVGNADGAEWSHGRAAIRPSLARRQFDDLKMFEKNFQIMLESLPGGREPVDLQELAFRYTLDIATEFFCHRSVNVLQPEAASMGEKFAKAFGVAIDTIAQRIRLGALAPLYYNPDFKPSIGLLHGFLEPVVSEAVQRVETKNFGGEKGRFANGDRYSFLDTLASESMHPRKIRGQLMNILIAARDTSASLMSAAFFTMASRPDIQAKVRAELEAQVPDGRAPTYDDLKNMTYLSWVLKECLRLYPPVPMNMRVANKDTFLPVGGGPDGSAPCFVPKGQEVSYIVWTTHRRKDLWGPDAEEFRPERWGEPNSHSLDSAHHFRYVPFNAGPRICPGQQFALTEAAYVVARLLQEFSGLEAPEKDPGEWTENLTLTCSIGQGSWARLTRRGEK